MADRDSERDRRVRELLSDGSKKKDQLGVLNQAQAEIGDIQSELQNHLSMEQAADRSRLQQAQTISQAATGMMAMEGSDQLQGQVSMMNPQTQQAMGKYGVKPTSTHNASRNQSGGRVVTKTGDTTNIKNESITNNHTEIRVTQPSIPISQPNIAVSAPAASVKREDNTSKFKAWLSGMFARQENEAEIQKKEYRKKEWNLGRTTSRLMKRIEEATSGLSSKLNPRNMTSTLAGQIKWLLLIFGATMIGKVWRPAMKFLANLEGGFRAVFGLPMNDDLRAASSGTISMIDQIKSFIGIKKGETDTLIGGIGKVFMQGINKLIDRLKFWFEDRANAIKSVEFPNISTPDFGLLGPVLSPLMEGLTDTFKGLTQYIGDLITVAMGGSKGRVKMEARRVARKAQDVFTDTTGKKTSAGDTALMTGKGRNYMRDSDYDMFGNLKGNASSTQAMSRSLISLFNDKSNKAHTAEIGTGVGQLMGLAKRDGQVVIDPELLPYLGITPADVLMMQRNRQLRQDKYRIIGVRPTTDAQRKEMGAYTGNAGFWTGGVAGTVGGAAAGAALGSAIPGVGNVIGGIAGGIVGAIGGGFTGSAVGSAGDALLKKWTSNGLYPKLVKSDSGQRGDDGSLGVPKMMWVLTKEGADYVTARFTKGMTNKTMDLTNQEFYNKLRKIEEQQKRRNNVRGPLTQNLSTNNLQSSMAASAAVDRQEYNMFESKDKDSWNMKHYGNWNSAMDNLSGALSNFGSYSADQIRQYASYVGRKVITTKQMNERAGYVVKRFMREGLTKEQALGVAANIMRESGFNETSFNSKDGSGSNAGPSGGIVGWHDTYDGRTHNLTDACRYLGVSDIRKASFEDQVEYLVHQFKNQRAMATGGGVNGRLTIMDNLKNARDAAEATVLMERGFESSADWKKEGDRTRIGYAHHFAKLLDENPNLGNTSGLRSSSNVYLKGVDSSQYTSGQSIAIGWLGDSQSVVANGSFPLLVGLGLETSFKFYGRVSANAEDYLRGTHKKLGESATNIKELGNSGCPDALKWMLKTKPKYVIIELGHNGVNGLSQLNSTLKSSGISTVLIKMWPYRDYRGKIHDKAEMDQSYASSGIRPDITVDLTSLNVPLSKDGVHLAGKKAAAIAAREVISQLKGGGMTTGTQDGSDDFLKTPDTPLNRALGAVSNGLNWVADKIDGMSGGNKEIQLADNLTPEQKRIVKKIGTFNAATEEANTRSWMSLGAKVDNQGVYLQNGDLRTYVRTDGAHSGMFGLTEDDIDYIQRVDKNGKPTRTQLTDDELEIAKKSAVQSVDSMISDYSDKTKGKGYNDFMTDKMNRPMGYNIGKFKDTGNFSETAQKDFNFGISFIIYPSKDLKRYTMVSIGKRVICSQKIIMGDVSPYYGPIIYHKGAHWFTIGTDRRKRIFSDVQPICQIHNVMLTPKASLETFKLLNFIDSMGQITAKNGSVFKQDGTPLTQAEIQLAKRYGIISENFVLGKEGNREFRGYNIKDHYNTAVGVGKYLVDSSREKSVDNYINQVGKTAEERKKYYNSHKDEFTTVDGIIYDAHGYKWGTVDNKGNTKFYDTDTFKSTILKEGKKGAENNLNKIEEKHNLDFAKTKGYISRDAQAKFLLGVSGYSTRVKLDNNKTALRSISGTRRFSIGLKSIDIPYKAFIYPDGSVKEYYVKGNELESTLRDNGLNVKLNGFTDTKTRLSSKTLDGLDKLIAAKISNSLKGDESAYKFILNAGGKQNRKRDNVLDKLRRDSIKKGVKISKITADTVYYDDGDNEVLHGISQMTSEEADKLKNDINGTIAYNNKQKRDIAIDDAFKKSGLQKIYQDYADSANNGSMQYIKAYGNYVATTGGDIFGYKGSDGKVHAINGRKVYEDTFNYFNTDTNRMDFYSSVLGNNLKTTNTGQYYQIKDKNGNIIRTKIDTSKDLSEFMANGLNTITSGAERLVDGEWKTLTGKEKTEALGQLRAPVKKMIQNGELTNKLINMLSKAYGVTTSTAAKTRQKQLDEATKQKGEQRQSNTYLKSMAENLASQNNNLDSLTKEIQNIQNDTKKELRQNRTLTELADILSDKDHGYNLNNLTVYTANKGNISGAIHYNDIKAAKELSNTTVDSSVTADGMISVDEQNRYGIKRSKLPQAKGAFKSSNTPGGSPIYKINNTLYVAGNTGNMYEIKNTGQPLGQYDAN